ncbi:hypothetical protein HELRODRAFT_185763 [Helobdella robusta]|uniref:Eukaryotic translation initiation factor 5 n=1 Tax=Helobdella robusta TaxID=6412 RepID=T1FN94_HELRO|nr:hypothetical protein HELRODRAFT_185763 [Helobdella robusta]ESO00648.1 hypothetical protein HELRODRAFT_185763 [Helobdella robusta]
MSVNVNRNVTDVFYRYKMPRLIAKVEGKGNGIKTVIVNMSDIAKSLSRPATYPTKYFGCELGAQTQFDLPNDRYIVNGSHEAGKLQDLLDGFIKKFVLCPECDNPETNLTVYQKKQQILQNCIACGHQAIVDMRHKLTTFILKNPPEQETQNATETPGKKDKKDKSGSKSKSKSSTKGKETNDNGNGNGDVSHDASDNKKYKASRLSKDEDEDDDWGEDTSDAAVQARKEGLSHAAKNLTISDDLQKTPQERVDLFYSFVQQRKVANMLGGAEREKELMLEAERLDVRDKAPMVLLELLFDSNMLTQIKQYKSLLRRFTDGNEKAQKYLLGAFEQLVGNDHHDLLMPKTAHILKAFYEEDILDEEVIIDWDKKASKKYLSKDICKELHSKAEPFIKWLKEAEEESSDDEEDEVEVVYSDKVSTPQIQTSITNASNATSEENDEDDLNIDDI